MNSSPGDGLPQEGAHVIRYERLRQGQFYADFRRDKRLDPEVYHCIIQREGSTQILSWSQYRSLENAIAAARSELEKFIRKETLAVTQPPNPVC